MATVFPLEGEVTAFVRGGNEVEWWSVAQDWVTDLLPTRRSWGEPVIERLRELKLDHSRIGVSGLSGLLRAPEGTVVSGMLEKLKAAFPGARFENATELLQDARSVKGPRGSRLDRTRRGDSRQSSSRRYSRKLSRVSWKTKWSRRFGKRSSPMAAITRR